MKKTGPDAEKNMFEYVSDGVFRINSVGEYIWLNPAMAEIYGYKTAGEMISIIEKQESKKVYSNPEDYNKFIRQINANGIVVDFESEQYRSDGSIIWTSTNVHSVRDETGNVLYYEGTVKDISQRKQSELVLQARMRLAEQAIPFSLDDILQATLDEAEKLTGSLIGFFHFMDAGQTSLKLQNWSKRTLLEFCKADGKGMHYPIDQAGVWADCARMAQPIIYNNYHAVPNQKGMPKGHAVVDRILTLPIMRGNSIVAIIGVGNKPRDYNQQDQEAVAMLADLAWDIAERKLAEDELKKANELLKAQILEIQTLHETLKEQAVRDALTGLFNRRYLTETVERELARAKRDGSPVCALMMDIDHFKEFNDSYGHNFGDEILVRLSTVLKNNTRTGDIACRFGGDEFIIILPGADIKEALQRAEIIKENFSHSSIQLGGMAVSPMISIGISAFPRHGKTGDELINAADGALYHAKNAGRNRIEIWEE